MWGWAFGLWHNASFPGISGCEQSVPLPLLPHVPAVLRGARWDPSSEQEELLHGAPVAGPGQQPGGHGWAVRGGWVINSWSQIPPSATSLQRGLFSASLSSEEIRYFTLAFVSVPTKDLQSSSSEAERDLSLREHVKGIIINVRKNKNKLAAKMPIIS